MKKATKIAIITTLLVILCSVVTFASTTLIQNKQKTEMKQQQIGEKSLQVIDKISDNTEAIKSVRLEEDTKRNMSFYKVMTNQYEMQLEQGSENLVGLYNKNNQFNSSNTMTKEQITTVINTLYGTLDLPQNYDLVYLEKVEDTMWEANYQKQYGDVYNQYESVKIFFAPANNQIIALTVFNESYTQVVSNEIMQNVAIASLINENIITNSNEVLEANKDIVKIENTNGNELKKVWKLAKEDEHGIKEIFYIDIENGNIIGGDTIK